MEHCVADAESHPAGSADFLFGLRMFSFAVSAVITVCFTFPSFWLMEQAAFDEEAGTFFLQLVLW